MAGLPAVPIDGLRDAVLLTATNDYPLRVTVCSVELRQAPALLDLLVKAQRQPPGWIVTRDRKLRHLSRIANEAEIILDVILPVLMETPDDDDASRLLLRYGWSLHHVSRKVDGPGGPFSSVASTAGALLRRHSDHLHKRTRGIGWLRDNVDALRASVLALKTTIVEIPYGDGDEDPPGGGEGPSGREEPREGGNQQA
ncbi:hypothetical protein HU200_001008 [Digitaria exilis]|uniref:Uncharacterized protein n=1 Tax=Digitaria exilis TaxID=1010633 RepID=A0A835G0T7_9POAL|nr:hypothetical protein HU200_001008 [Digitaria exilis]